MDKEFFGYISLVLALATYLPYMWSTMRGPTRPHVFSWIIWSFLNAVGAAGQLAGHAGPGAWAFIFTSFSCITIALLSLRHAGKNITRHDAIIFFIALCAIPLWYVTDSPLSAVILVATIDVMGYIPTIRKTWVNPQSEMPLLYLMSNLKHAASLLAMNQYSLTTIFYPALLFIANFIMTGIIYYRRAKEK